MQSIDTDSAPRFASTNVIIPGLPPLHTLWLLDNGTQRAAFGQRLIDVIDLDVENPPLISNAYWAKSTSAVTNALKFVITGRYHSTDKEEEKDLVVEFVNGVTARVPTFLLQSLYPPWMSMSTPSPSSSTIISSPFEYKDMRDRLILSSAFSKLQSLGAVYIRGCQSEKNSILTVANIFGIIQETNYGQVFDVKTEKSPSNLAFSTAALALHTDNPYRVPIPGFQCLLCLQPAKVGGLTLFADGFKAAMELQRIYPDSYRLLSQKFVTYRYADDSSQFESTRPVIEVDSSTGRIISIAVNNRSLAPLDPSCPELYKALSDFQKLLNDKRFGFSIRLEKGDFIMWDNFRIVHGREGYQVDANDDSNNDRHLQGCYVSRDSVTSNAAVLLERT
jgi:hypothetical protein